MRRRRPEQREHTATSKGTWLRRTAKGEYWRRCSRPQVGKAITTKGGGGVQILVLRYAGGCVGLDRGLAFGRKAYPKKQEVNQDLGPTI
ncbi:hypothetical protein NDU88_003492 [Pleurodeles waltl]|uniref:Uncharacterized protein n=1 Tax=Pleurodeles waltl TaxID=8319 RepID=A0AAV7QBW0_PLEWA|nr:hypothetical protein NDU88_003492 [Pleurodeles waltl]